jgi:RNAse (barnase) inhibitor barstar
MSNLDTLLGSVLNSGLREMGDGIASQEVSAAASRHKLHLFVLDLQGVESKERFLRACAEAMQFPQHFGDNWDAFEDCLTDLEWCPAGGYVVLVENSTAFIRRAPAEWETVRAIFQDAAAFWRERHVPFFIILLDK